MSHRDIWLVLAIVVAGLHGSCAKKSGSDASAEGKVLDAGAQSPSSQKTGYEQKASKESSPAPASTIYTYVDDMGRMHMVDDLKRVPKEFADRVVATDTGKDRSERIASDRVVVLDLRRSGEAGPLNYSVVDLSSYSKPSGPAGDPARLGKRMADRGVDGLRSFLGLNPQSRSSDVVVLYSAPWCGFCRKAEAYLKSKGVAFVKRNIESDRGAAMELDRKLRAAGMVGGGIPVLDIKGTLVVGFDRRRIDSLLGL